MRELSQNAELSSMLSVPRPSLTSHTKDRLSQPTGVGNLLHALYVTTTYLEAAENDFNVTDENSNKNKSPQASRYRLSIYDLNRIIVDFKAAAVELREKLKKEHDNSIGAGNAILRHAANNLNASVEIFSSDFRAPSRKIRFDRYAAVSDFIDVLYGKSFTVSNYSPRQIYTWCRIDNHVRPKKLEE